MCAYLKAESGGNEVVSGGLVGELFTVDLADWGRPNALSPKSSREYPDTDLGGLLMIDVVLEI